MTDATRVAVVAGGTAGVGRSVVSHLIAAGYDVGVLARGKDRLEALAREYGDRVACLPCDVSNAAEVSRAGSAIEELLGPVEVWVNSAMLTSFSPFAAMEAGEFDRIVDTTLLGAVNGTRTALALMERRNTGRIVNIGSGFGYRSVPYQSAYCTSEHGINGFSAALRSELIREGSRITLSLVQLPAVNTPQFDWALNRMAMRPQPAPPVFEPDVAARGVMRAVREGRREYFVGRSVIRLILGNMIFPDWFDHRLADVGAEMQKSDIAEPGGRPNNLAGPVPSAAPVAEGRFGARAENRAIIVDADRLRLSVFWAAPAVGLLIGLVLG